MEWVSLSAFYTRGVLGIRKFHLREAIVIILVPLPFYFDLPASSVQPELPFQPGVGKPDLAKGLGDYDFSTGRKTTLFNVLNCDQNLIILGNVISKK